MNWPVTSKNVSLLFSAFNPYKLLNTWPGPNKQWAELDEPKKRNHSLWKKMQHWNSTLRFLTGTRKMEEIKPRHQSTSTILIQISRLNNCTYQIEWKMRRSSVQSGPSQREVVKRSAPQSVQFRPKIQRLMRCWSCGLWRLLRMILFSPVKSWSPVTEVDKVCWFGSGSGGWMIESQWRMVDMLQIKKQSEVKKTAWRGWFSDCGDCWSTVTACSGHN